MNDELPTDERLRRIERGVQRRIGARRRVAQRIAVGAAAVVLVAGGATLLRPLIGATSSATSAGGSAAEAPAFSSAAAAAGIVVECHGTVTVTARADPAGLPASALAACARAAHGSAYSAQDDGTATSASPSASSATSTLCRAKDGALHVYPGGAAVCATHGMRVYAAR